MPRARSRSASASAPGLRAGRRCRGCSRPSAESQAVPGEVVLSDGRTLSRWAYPQTAAIVRKTPSRAAPAVGRLHFLTEDGQAEVYLVLKKARVARTGVTWMKVALAKRQRRQRLGRGERAGNAAHRPRPARGAPLEASRDALQRSGARDLERPRRRRASVAADAGRPLLPAREAARDRRPDVRALRAWAPAPTRRRSPTGPGAAWWASTGPTSPGSSRDGRRMAASACATPTSPGSGT